MCQRAVLMLLSNDPHSTMALPEYFSGTMSPEAKSPLTAIILSLTSHADLMAFSRLFLSTVTLSYSLRVSLYFLASSLSFAMKPSSSHSHSFFQSGNDMSLPAAKMESDADFSAAEIIFPTLSMSLMIFWISRFFLLYSDIIGE